MILIKKLGLLLFLVLAVRGAGAVYHSVYGVPHPQQRTVMQLMKLDAGLGDPDMQLALETVRARLGTPDFTNQATMRFRTPTGTITIGASEVAPLNAEYQRIRANKTALVSDVGLSDEETRFHIDAPQGSY